MLVKIFGSGTLVEDIVAVIDGSGKNVQSWTN